MSDYLRSTLRPFIPVLRRFFSIFFDPSVLIGPRFDNSFVGYRRLFQALWQQKLLGFNRGAPWPMSPTTHVSCYENLIFDPLDLHNLSSPGCYFQNFAATISIGSGSYIGPNVGIITANHDPTDLRDHTEGQPVVIGSNCWVGMNSVILPGVTLGDGIIVGAGSVVTKSFSSPGVIAGNPARFVKSLGER